MADPRKRARADLSTLEIAAYGTTMLAAGAFYWHQDSTTLSAPFNNAAAYEQPARLISPPITPVLSDIPVVVAVAPVKTAALPMPLPPAPAADTAPAIIESPEPVTPLWPRIRAAFDVAHHPWIGTMMDHIRAEKARHAAIAEQLEKMDLPVPPYEVAHAISYGADWTGADELYLNTLARAESTYEPEAHNGSGGGKGACGLFQFRAASTYLQQIYLHAAKFPPRYEWLNGAVEQTLNSEGNITYRVSGNADADAVYAACYDPVFSSMLAGFMSLDNRTALEDRVDLGRAPNFADLYIAHFLGTGGGTKFLRAYSDEDKHDASITKYASADQRAANPGIFRRVSTVGEFYDFFVEDKGMSTRPFRITAGQFAEFALPAVEDIPLPTPAPTRPVPKPQ